MAPGWQAFMQGVNGYMNPPAVAPQGDDADMRRRRALSNLEAFMAQSRAEMPPPPDEPRSPEITAALAPRPTPSLFDQLRNMNDNGLQGVPSEEPTSPQFSIGLTTLQPAAASPKMPASGPTSPATPSAPPQAAQPPIPTLEEWLSRVQRTGAAVAPQPLGNVMYPESTEFGAAHPRLASVLDALSGSAAALDPEGPFGSYYARRLAAANEARNAPATQAKAGLELTSKYDALVDTFRDNQRADQTVASTEAYQQAGIDNYKRLANDPIMLSPGQVAFDRDTRQPIYTAPPSTTTGSDFDQFVAKLEADLGRPLTVEEVLDYRGKWQGSARQGGLTEQIVESIVGKLSDPSLTPEQNRARAQQAIGILTRIQPGPMSTVVNDAGEIIRYDFPKANIGGNGAASPVADGGRRSPVPAGTNIKIADYENAARKVAELGRAFQPGFVGPYQGPYQSSKASGLLSWNPFMSTPEGYGTFQQLNADLKNSVIKLITGAQMNLNEETRILQQLPTEKLKDQVWLDRYQLTMDNVAFMLNRIRQLSAAGEGVYTPPTTATESVKIRDSRTGRTGVYPGTAAEAAAEGYEVIQ